MVLSCRVLEHFQLGSEEIISDVEVEASVFSIFFPEIV